MAPSYQLADQLNAYTSQLHTPNKYQSIVIHNDCLKVIVTVVKSTHFATIFTRVLFWSGVIFF